MRILLGVLLAAISLAPPLAVAGTSVAEGSVSCSQWDTTTGKCLVQVNLGGTPGTPSTALPAATGEGAACYWDPAKQNLSHPPAGPVDCTSEFGSWSNAHNCYIQVEKPQPEADDPAWQGHKPGDGAVYGCYQPETKMLVYLWLQTPPAGPGPTPGQVAQLAIKQMGLTAIDIGLAPKPGQDSVGLVGMPVWMWVQAPSDHTYGPATATASAGGITVTATAKVAQITWDMGDGTTVVCASAGTPYEASYGQKSSPDCGHTYAKSSAHQPGEKYTVTATSEWVITWAGAGQTGTIRLGGLTRSAQITIGEAQVLVD